MEIIKIWNDTASERQLREISGRLASGEIAIIPTDTTYAIVCNALNQKAVDEICRIKGINPEKSNLSIICSDIAMAAEYARIDNKVFRLMKENVPGCFTFLLRAASGLPRAFKGRKVVGVRIPACEFPRRVAETLGNPLLAAGIVYSDEDHAVSPGLIADAYDGKVDFMVEDAEGDTSVSTVVDCTGAEPEIVREGKGELA